LKNAMRILAFLIPAVLIFGIVAFAAPGGAIMVTVDGERTMFQDQDPVIVDGRTLVPVRGVFEQLGFNVSWNEAQRTVIMTGPEHIVRIPIGSPTFTTNNQVFILDVPAQIINDRTLIPIRFPLESVGATVGWNEAFRTVYIQSQAATQAPEPTPEPTPEPVVIVPAAITALPATATLRVGETQQLTATVQPENADDRTVTWTSSNPAVATVSAAGIVTAVSGGNATITGTTVNDLTSTVTVTVRTQSSIVLPNRRATAAEREAWIADYDALGGASELEREIVRLINVERTANNLATVQPDDALMQAARYYTQLQVNLNLAQGHNVGPYRVEGATHGASAAVAEAFGGRMGDNTIGNASTGHNTAAEIVAAWMNSPTQRAFILNPAHRFIGAGTFEGGNYGRFTYLYLSNLAGLTGVLPTGITVSPTAASIGVGAPQQITATVQPATATNRNVTWTTSNNAIATVSTTGLVTGLSPGTATITATTVNDLYATVTITVGGVPPTRIDLTPATGSVAMGGTLTLVPTFQPANSDTSVNWTSSNTALATVSAEGVVTPVAVGGPVTITATSAANSSITAVAVLAVVPSAVIPPGSVNLIMTPSAVTMSVGDPVRNLFADVRPENASNRDVTWAALRVDTNDPSPIIAVLPTSPGANTATLTAITTGVARIRVTSVANPSLYDEITITIQ